jgi:GDP-L-fucose synthase
VFDSSKPDGTPRKFLDTSKLNTLGWRATIDLKSGIQRVYDWFQKNYTETQSTVNNVTQRSNNVSARG